MRFNTGYFRIIEPMGFHWDDANVYAGGLDYHEFADMRANFDDF